VSQPGHGKHALTLYSVRAVWTLSATNVDKVPSGHVADALHSSSSRRRSQTYFSSRPLPQDRPNSPTPRSLCPHGLSHPRRSHLREERSHLPRSNSHAPRKTPQNQPAFAFRTLNLQSLPSRALQRDYRLSEPAWSDTALTRCAATPSPQHHFPQHRLRDNLSIKNDRHRTNPVPVVGAILWPCGKVRWRRGAQVLCSVRISTCGLCIRRRCLLFRSVASLALHLHEAVDP